MFNFSFDKRTLYIILAVLIGLTVLSYAGDPSKLLGLVLTLPGVLIAITFHEFAHAFAADKLGDDTARMQGRLNLNPATHLDPFGFVLLLFAGFGWGKPVEINPRNFSRKFTMDAGEAIVSVAGPLMNMALAVVFTAIQFLLIKLAPAFLFTQAGSITMAVIQYTIIVNIGLGVFNLIPLPPLDGSKILKNFLPFNAKNWFISHEHIFYIVFVVIWITGIAGTIISPINNAIYTGIQWVIGTLIGWI